MSCGFGCTVFLCKAMLTKATIKKKYNLLMGLEEKSTKSRTSAGFIPGDTEGYGMTDIRYKRLYYCKSKQFVFNVNSQKVVDLT